MRLATRPTATVTVTITGHSGTDITLDTDELTFTTTNWANTQATPQFCAGARVGLIYWAREGTATSADFALSTDRQRSATSIYPIHQSDVTELGSSGGRVSSLTLIWRDTAVEGEETFTILATWHPDMPDHYDSETPIEAVAPSIGVINDDP